MQLTSQFHVSDFFVPCPRRTEEYPFLRCSVVRSVSTVSRQRFFKGSRVIKFVKKKLFPSRSAPRTTKQRDHQVSCSPSLHVDLV